MAAFFLVLVQSYWSETIGPPGPNSRKSLSWWHLPDSNGRSRQRVASVGYCAVVFWQPAVNASAANAPAPNTALFRYFIVIAALLSCICSSRHHRETPA